MKCSIKMAGGIRGCLSTVFLEIAPSSCEIAKDHLKVKFSVFQSLGNWTVP